MNHLSEKQLNANKTNAQLGGVKTESGKAISSQNALTHGILSQTTSEYENVSYEPILEQLEADFPPRNVLESMLLSRIVSSHIKLARISKAESELMKVALNPTVEVDFDKYISHQGYKPIMTSELVEKLGIYSRYETSAENRLYKAMQQLMLLRRMNLEQVYE